MKNLLLCALASLALASLYGCASDDTASSTTTTTTEQTTVTPAPVTTATETMH